MVCFASLIGFLIFDEEFIGQRVLMDVFALYLLEKLTLVSTLLSEFSLFIPSGINFTKIITHVIQFDISANKIGTLFFQ